MSEIVNGVRTSYGPRTTDKKAASKVVDDGVVSTVVMQVNGDDLPTYVGSNATDVAVPAGAFITEATAYVAGTSTADVVLTFVKDSDGSASTGSLSATLVTSTKDWDLLPLELIAAEDLQITATGPAAGEVAYVTVTYRNPVTY